MIEFFVSHNLSSFPTKHETLDPFLFSHMGVSSFANIHTSSCKKHSSAAHTVMAMNMIRKSQ